MGYTFLDIVGHDDVNPLFFFGVNICRVARYSANSDRSGDARREQREQSDNFSESGAVYDRSLGYIDVGCTGSDVDSCPFEPTQRIYMFTQCMTSTNEWEGSTGTVVMGDGYASVVDLFVERQHSVTSGRNNCGISDWAEGLMNDGDDPPWYCRVFPIFCDGSENDGGDFNDSDGDGTPDECEGITDPRALAVCITGLGGSGGSGGSGGDGSGGSGGDGSGGDGSGGDGSGGDGSGDGSGGDGSGGDGSGDGGSDPDYCDVYPSAASCGGSSGGGGDGGNDDGGGGGEDPGEDGCERGESKNEDGECVPDDEECGRICERVEEVSDLAATKFPFGMNSWLSFGAFSGGGVGCTDFNISMFGTTRALGWCDVGIYNLLKTMFRAGIMALMIFGFSFGVVKSVSQT